MGSAMIEQGRYTCALGAMQTVVAIPRALPVLHAGPGCGSMVSDFFGRSAGHAGGNSVPCTNTTETDVVFGGEARLRELLDQVPKVLEADLEVVLTGCTADIVGDDTAEVVRGLRDEGRRIVHVSTAGFKSSNWISHSRVVEAIVDQYVDRHARTGAPRDRGLVNVFSSVPFQDPFWKGNLRELKRILAGIGLRANILFGPESKGLAEWATIPEAGFNLVVSAWAGLDIARHLEEKYDQPFFHFPYFPIGGNETAKFLRAVTDFAGLDGRRTEAFVAREEAGFYEEIQDLATFLLEFRYGLPNHYHAVHDANYVVGFAKFLLNEVGLVPREQFVVDGTPEEHQEAIRRELSETSDKREIPVSFDPDAGLAQDAIRAATHPGRGLLIGSGWDKLLAQDKGYDFLSAAVPSPYRLVLTTGYLGYRGGLRLVEDIYDRVLATYK